MNFIICTYFSFNVAYCNLIGSLEFLESLGLIAVMIIRLNTNKYKSTKEDNFSLNGEFELLCSELLLSIGEIFGEFCSNFKRVGECSSLFKRSGECCTLFERFGEDV